MSGEEKSTVLIAGGSGVIGKYLTSLLLEHDYKVVHLSRNANQFGVVRVFRWNPEKRIIDPLVFEGVDYVINLTGENIGKTRWTTDRKNEIVRSRIEPASLLFKTIAENHIRIKAYISASAIGYYGAVTSDRIFTEEDPPGKDFMGTTCRKWEESTDLFAQDGIRTVKLRTALYLERTNTALVKMTETGKLGFLVRVGNGHQYMPWIHIADICSIYLKAIEDENMNGAYNAVSPQHTTHDEFMHVLAHVLDKPLMRVPALTVRLRFGEMSDVVLKGSRVSAQKIINSGYKFKYSNLKDALSEVYSITD